MPIADVLLMLLALVALTMLRFGAPILLTWAIRALCCRLQDIRPGAVRPVP